MSRSKARFRTIADISGYRQTDSMLKAIRSPWFEFGLAALFASVALAFEEERTLLLGLAATAVFWGFINCISSNKEDR